jgi:hypothetical protein
METLEYPNARASGATGIFIKFSIQVVRATSPRHRQEARRYRNDVVDETITSVYSYNHTRYD